MSAQRGDAAELVTIASDLIRLRTANPPGHEARAARWLGDYLAKVASDVVVEPVAEHRANVLITFDFGPGPALVLCSHLDVVPVQDDDQWNPRIVDGRLIGRGACDAKGALAAMAVSAGRLVSDRSGLRGSLHLLAVADEESSAAGVKEAVSRGLGADVAIIGEPTDNALLLSSRGAIRMAVTFTGRAAHSSTPARGLNALYPAARFILAIELLHETLIAATPSGACSATVISGGTKMNMVPDSCTIHVDRRLSPVEQSAPAALEIEALAQAAAVLYPGILVAIEPVGAWIEPFSVPADHWFATDLAPALGGRWMAPFPAGTDAPFLIAAGVPTAILGPGSIEVAHGDDESVAVAELESAADLYEQIARMVLSADFPRGEDKTGSRTATPG